MPTPDARDGHAEGLAAGERRLEKWGTLGLQTAVKRMPTPLASDKVRGANSPGGKTLGAEVKRMATPTKQDATSRDYRSPGLKERLEARQEERSQPLTEIVGGQLSPDWVSWLQGWPISWTSLEPMSRESFQAWLDAHTGRSESWWAEEPPIPRIASGVPHRVARIQAIGDGQVPACATLAWRILSGGR